MRALLTSSLVALALGGCSFSYSSGSAPPHSHSNHGKSMPKKSGSKKVDNTEKALPRSSGEKPLSKADPDDTETSPPKREVEDDSPERTKTPPKRTKGAPKRTPTGDDDTVEANEDVSPSSVGTLKAKTKPATPPSSTSTLVAPH